MASTTKIMTAITAIENCKDLDEKFEISPKAVGISGTSLYLRKGDVYSTRDLLYTLMLISGNDASVAIAEHVGGSTPEFVTMMNELAKKIGAKSTHFANTHGLDADGHYTTAYDLAYKWKRRKSLSQKQKQTFGNFGRLHRRQNGLY